MSESKLKNIKAVNEMIAGNHRTQTKRTFGFSDVNYQSEKSKLREVGEIWEEKNALGETVCWWKQNKGYRSRYHRHPDEQAAIDAEIERLNSFYNCPKSECTCKTRTRLDEVFRKKTGMCEDCVFSMETKLKIEGKFNEYAINKMKSNAESFFKDADKEVEVIKNELLNITFAGDANDPNNPNERWSLQNPEAFIENIDNQYKNFKESVFNKLEGK